jgi:hypothetical protein
MKTYWGSGGIAPRILTSEVDGGEWSASRPGRFTRGKRDPGTYWIGGWVGPRTSVDTAVAKRKVACLCRESNPGRSARGLITVLTELPETKLNETEKCMQILVYTSFPNAFFYCFIRILRIDTQLSVAQLKCIPLAYHFSLRHRFQSSSGPQSSAYPMNTGVSIIFRNNLIN